MCKILEASRPVGLGAILFLGAIFFAALPVAQARADASPSETGDTGDFTARAAALFSKALPTYKIDVSGPLALSVGKPSGGSLNVNLQATHASCARNPAQCEAELRDFVEKMSSSLAAMDEPPDRSRLRAIVRIGADVELAEQVLQGKDVPVAEPLVGDLWMMCAMDLPGAIQILSPSQLAALKLSRDEALTACKENMGAALTDLTPTRRDYPRPGVNIVTGNAYDSSWMLFPERWAAEAEKVEGDLLVAAPAPDVILYAADDNDGAANALAEAAATVAAQSRRPLSTAVFRWTPTGWKELKQ